MAGDRSPAAMRRKKGKAATPSGRTPRGSSVTVIPGVTPERRVMANDVAVHHVAGGSLLDVGTIVAPAVAVPIRASLECSEVLIQADPDNAEDVFWGMDGAAAKQTMQLKPGDLASIPVKDASQVYVRSAGATGSVNFTITGL